MTTQRQSPSEWPPSRKRPFAKLVLVALATVVTSQVVPLSAAAAPTPATTSFESVTPCRLLDTRESQGLDRPVSAGSTLVLEAAGQCGITDEAAALSLTVTSTRASGTGFLTVFSADTDQPGTSNINFSTNSTIANGVITAVSPGAALKIFANTESHIIVDVTGQFVPRTESTAGRFVALSPHRVLDTRTTNDRGSHPVTIPLSPAVPLDAVAVVVSVTIVDGAQPGFATVHPAGTTTPGSSTVNTDSTDRTRATTTITPVSEAGFTIHRHSTSDLVVDIWGYMTGESAELSGDGLYVPTTPTRIWDSRASFDPLHPGGWTSKALNSTPSAAVVANVTVVDTIRPGWISTFPAGHVNNEVSMLNVASRQPRAALTIVQTSDAGLGVKSLSGAHVIVDVYGYFTGPAVPAGPDIDSNPGNQVAHDALFISDSSIAGIRWSGNLDQLVGSNFVTRLESCRRLIGQSCRGREGYAPATALSTLATTPGDYDTLIIATGYNDAASSFDHGFERIMSVARQRGINQVVWFTYRTEVTYVSPRALSNVQSFISHNRILEAKVASGRYPELHLLDWNTYSAGRTAWVTPDGVHLQPDGAVAVSWYLSNKLAYLDRKPCPAPSGVNTAGGWCADPDRVGYQG